MQEFENIETLDEYQHVLHNETMHVEANNNNNNATIINMDTNMEIYEAAVCDTQNSLIKK